MARTKFSVLNSRQQSSVITQILNLIDYFSSIFPIRERKYLKNISREEGKIYWLDDLNKKVVAIGLVEHNHIFSTYETTFLPIGHIISTVNGLAENIINHILEDYQKDNIILLAKPSLADSFEYKNFDFIPFNPLELEKYLPDLSNYKTSYFNVSNEPLKNALIRKNYYVYIKLNFETKEKLLKIIPELKVKLISN